MPLDEFYTNLRQMCLRLTKEVKKKQLILILLSPPPGNEQQKIKDTAERYGEQAIKASQRSNANTKLYAKVVDDVYQSLKDLCEATWLTYKVAFLDVFTTMQEVDGWQDSMFCDGERVCFVSSEA